MSSPEAKIIPQQMWDQFRFDKSFRPEALMELQQQFVGALQKRHPTPLHALKIALKTYAEIQDDPKPNTTLLIGRAEMPRDHAITIRESTFSIGEELLSFLEITHSYPNPKLPKPGVRRNVWEFFHRDNARPVPIQHTYAVKRIGKNGVWEGAKPEERILLEYATPSQHPTHSLIEIYGAAPVW